MSASLEGLPDELLLTIIGYIPDSRALRNLNLTSRRLQSISEKTLYSQFTLSQGYPTLLLRTFVTRPDLSQHLKNVSWVDDSDPIRRHQRGLDPKPDSLIIQKLKSEGFYAKQLADKLQGPFLLNAEHILSALLMFSEKLERLRVSGTYGWDDHVYWFRPILQATPHAFSNLTEAFIQGPMRLENVAALFILPSLRTLDLTQVVYVRHQLGRMFEWEVDYPRLSFASLLENKGSKIEYLHFWESFIGLQDLWALFAVLPDLKSFTYEHMENDMPDLDNSQREEFNYIQLGKQLSKYHHSLATLRVWDDTLSSGGPGNDIYALLTPLCHSANLRLVECCIMHFRPANGPQFSDVLPQGLQELTLVAQYAREYYDTQYASEYYDTQSAQNLDNHAADFDRNLYGIIERRRTGQLPDLKSVTVAEWHPWFGHYPPSVEGIKKQFAELGVEFSSVPGEEGDSRFSDEEILVWESYGDEEPGWVFVDTTRAGSIY
ncbi:hypothetical protein CC80DRAFT_488056 [Byssothecium circinans]|uniref:F-box domain-containing protein n=1 Tax=Byssothecium circinans TaxID=147558 RepID=A0A6A5UKJ3_9PLEO|nr:hypothetical protein CC80DRAFT_488056 [Byssothecium circinans]